MKNFMITAIDTTGIQDYVFNSNSLKHIVGASGLVHWATHDWVFDELVKIRKTNVETKLDSDWIINDRSIIKDDLNSELVYAGGGNAVIIFKSPELAKEFTIGLTLRALLDAPGIQLIVSHTAFDWDNDVLSEKVKESMVKVNDKKLNRAHSTPLLGLGVTAECQYTRMPATEMRAETKKRPHIKVRVSSEVAAKMDAFDKANKRLRKTIDLPEDLDLVYDFGDFGTKHESSHIAVVHTDGNGMGKRIKEIADKHKTPKENIDYIKDLRDFSQSLEETSINALRATVRQLLESRDKDKENKIGGIVEIRDNKIPFRPLIFGGDDLTFVCDGRLGITLAKLYVKELTTPPLSKKQRSISARAGVAIVKSHYPFSRAVDMAEQLADSAKDYIRKQQRETSAIDWHFAASGIRGDLIEIRQREYTNQNGKLNMRPLCLDKTADWHSWDSFEKIMEEFNSERWVNKHNKIMSLRKALRSGPDAVKQFVTAYEIGGLPKVDDKLESTRTGWIDKVCTCFDVIEAIDFFVPFEGVKK